MKYAEALTALIDQRYETTKRNYIELSGVEPPTRDEVATSDRNIRIGAEVMGEMGVGDAFYEQLKTGDDNCQARHVAGEPIEFGTFENCREYGLTVSTGGWTFAVYEHRNSDSICVEGCRTTQVKPYGPYGGKDKWDVLASFGWKEYYAATKALIELMTLVRARPRVGRKGLLAAWAGAENV